MSTDRLIKWSKESKEFFESAEDKSVVLDLVISYGCASQTGEGFEELINTINSESIKRKVKKVDITDTSYLYRHVISQFFGKLTIPTQLKSWATGLDKDGFQNWYRQIKKDLFTDSNFKNAAIEMANKALFKSDNDGDIGKNIDFILEETAYTCLNFKNVNMVYL